MLLCASPAFGDILTVPGQYPTIQAAVDAASAGDTVLIDPGTYNESISVFEDITVQGLGTPESVVITGGVSMDVGRLGAVTVLGTLGFASELDVFNCIFDGGGVDVDNSAISFANTLFKNCSGGAVVGSLVLFSFDSCVFDSNTGGAVRPFDGVATFTGCEFIDNTGRAVTGQDLEFTDCLFLNNSDTSGPAAIQLTSSFGSCSIIGCDFIGNTSGGLAAAVYLSNDNDGAPAGVVTDCSFQNNTAGAGGGALRLSTVPNPPVTVSGTAFCGNSPSDIVGVVNLGAGNSFTAQCDCLADVNGDGSVSPADFTAWINAFNNSLPGCDQNDDGSCTPADFTAWIANFNIGC